MSNKLLTADLWELDPELYGLITKEKHRQRTVLDMIASENFTSLSVLQCLSCCLHNKYGNPHDQSMYSDSFSEGMPDQRNYECERIDEIENLAQKRSLEAFKLNADEWGVNVQPYSGSSANLAVYTGMVEPRGRIMGLDLPGGGHLTNGFYTTEKISASSIFFESMPYKVDPKSGLIDYDKLAKTAKLFNPKLIIAGSSCFSRCLDYKRLRQIADDNGAYLMADIAHISGLVVAGIIPSPFEYCDLVTTATHKTLRGPRAGVIFYRKGVRFIEANGTKLKYDLENMINQAVFPGLQGAPHIHAIAAIATAMQQATTPEFVEYQTQVVKNAQRLCVRLKSRGYEIVARAAEVHLVLVDLRSKGLTGELGERILDLISITCDKYAIPGDKSARSSGGISLGTSALTTRGVKEADIDKVVDFIDSALKIAQEVVKISGSKHAIFKNFNKVIENSKIIKTKIKNLRLEVENFCRTFPVPGCYNY